MRESYELCRIISPNQKLAKDNILRALIKEYELLGEYDSPILVIKELRSNSFLSIAALCNYKKV